MAEKGKETITAFDTVLTTNRIQMMKVFLSYLAPEQQSGLAVYIKFSELQYAMQLARQAPGRPLLHSQRPVLSLQSLLNGSLFNGNQEGILELLDELLPFSGPEERSKILNLKNMLVSMSKMREMMEMMEMMKELFPDGVNFGDGGNGDGTDGISSMVDMFSGMSGMDPMALAQLMQMFQNAPSDDADKTDKV